MELLAPAKLNLGLEILGRRDDGYHEIRTVMVAISLIDRIQVVASSEDRLTTAGIAVATDDNLVARTVRLARETWGTPPLDVTLSKRIPLAAGLGGGSSDAASTLLAAARLTGPSVAADLLPLAERLGSDVPFFLAGGPALVSGRGDLVTRVAGAPVLHAVVVVPALVIPRKTATLYAAIVPDDFSDGATVGAVAAGLGGLSAGAGALPNAFRRPLHGLVPGIADVARTIEVVSSLPANLSGAGPAHYVVCRDAGHAAGVAADLRAAFRWGRASIHAVRTMTGLPTREAAA